MKHILSLAMIFVLPAVLVACAGKKEDDAPAKKTATTPLTSNCLNGQTYCNPNQYNPYQQQGFQPYPGYPQNANIYYNYNGFVPYYQYQYNGYVGGNTMNFCSCPNGSQPVYHNSYGLGCVANNTVSPYAAQMQRYNLNPANTQWINIPQVSNYPNSYVSGSCYSSVGQACTMGTANTCGAGSICRATGPASSIGVCVRQ